MEDKQELFTIQDIIRLTRISQNTIYRYIRQGKIKTCKMIKSGKQVITIEKQELERFLGCSIKGDTTSGKQDTINNSIDATTGKQDTIIGSIYDKTLTKSDIKELFQELIQEQNTIIMKPIEEQALYRLGKIEQENNFLKAKVETLLQELEQYKSLPGPADMEKWKKEKEDLLSRCETIQQELEQKHIEELEARQKEQDEIKKSMVEAHRKEHKKELEAVKSKYEDYLQKEKEDLLSRAETIQKEQDSRYKVEIEKQKRDIEEAHREELEKLRKQAEEEKKQIAETWRKELEEARRPWWKFW